jgi:hypothetical protein
LERAFGNGYPMSPVVSSENINKTWIFYLEWKVFKTVAEMQMRWDDEVKIDEWTIWLTWIDDMWMNLIT